MHFSGTNGAEAAAVSKQPAEKLLVITRAGVVYLCTLSSAFDTSPLLPFGRLAFLIIYFLFFSFFSGERSSLAPLAMRDTSASTPGHHQWTSEYDEEKRERVKRVSSERGRNGRLRLLVMTPWAAVLQVLPVTADFLVGRI